MGFHVSLAEGRCCSSQHARNLQGHLGDFRICGAASFPWLAKNISPKYKAHPHPVIFMYACVSRIGPSKLDAIFNSMG